MKLIYGLFQLITLAFSADISLVVCEDDAKCNLLLDRAPKCLKKIIIFKDVRPATKQRAINRGVEIVKFSDVETMGSKQKYPEEVRIFHRSFVFRAQ